MDGAFAFKEQTVRGGSNTYHWTFTPNDSTYETVEGSIELSAKYTPSVSGVVYVGKAVAGEKPDAGKLLGAVSVDGVFSFEEDEFVEGEREYHWVFKPASDDYVEVRGTVTVTAEPAPQQSGSAQAKKGCGGFVGGTGLAFLMSALATAFVVGKRH